MQFTVECSSLADAFNDIKKALVTVEHVSLKATDKLLVVSATNKISNIIINIFNVQVEAEGECTAPLDNLMGIIRSRKIMEFTLDEGTLNFKSTEGRSYSGDITTLPYEEVVISTESVNLKLKMDTDKVKKFYDTVGAVVLQGAYGNKTPLPVYLSLTSEGTTALCYDNFHLAHVTDTSATWDKDYTLALLPTALSTIEAQAKGKGFSLVMCEGSIYAYNKYFKLQQPLVQTEGDDAEVIANIAEFIADVESKEATKVELDKSEFQVIFDNAMSFYVQGVPLDVRVGKKEVALQVVGSHGKVGERISATNVSNPVKASFKCEMSILAEVLTKIDVQQIPFSFIEDTCVYFSWQAGTKQSFYSSGLLE